MFGGLNTLFSGLAFCGIIITRSRGFGIREHIEKVRQILN